MVKEVLFGHSDFDLLFLSSVPRREQVRPGDDVTALKCGHSDRLQNEEETGLLWPSDGTVCIFQPVLVCGFPLLDHRPSCLWRHITAGFSLLPRFVAYLFCPGNLQPRQLLHHEADRRQAGFFSWTGASAFLHQILLLLLLENPPQRIPSQIDEAKLPLFPFSMVELWLFVYELQLWSLYTIFCYPRYPTPQNLKNLKDYLELLGSR